MFCLSQQRCGALTMSQNQHSTAHSSGGQPSSSSYGFSSSSKSSLSHSDLLKSPSTSTPERRAELLRLARKSRLQWILSGLDDEHKKNFLKYPSAELYRKIPAAECLQNVLTFLTNLVNDGEIVSIEALVPPEGLDEDYDEKIPLPSYETSHNSSGGPLNGYLMFIEKLKHPYSIDIVKLLQQFITKVEVMIRLENQRLLSSAPLSFSLQRSSAAAPIPAEDIDEKIAKDTWAFLKQVHGNMRDNILWKDETEEQWNQSMNSVEKFLFIKLYDSLFGNDAQLLEQDERIQERIESLSFLSPDHLDMKSLQDEWTRRRTHSEEALEVTAAGGVVAEKGSEQLTIGSVVKRLRDISLARCPADKLQCLKEVSQMVIQILTTSRKQAGRTSLPGADDFLPALILILKEANPAHLHSTTAYIQRYTHPSRLVSEAGYILTHFVSAIHFLETVDSAALTISPLEYEMCIAQSKAKKREKETEWGRRAAEAEDEQSRDQDSSREMIWKEDGQLISVAQYERNEKANRQSQRMRERESAELRSTYASLRERRMPHRLTAPLQPSSLPLPTAAAVDVSPVPAQAEDSVVQLHRALLLQQLLPHRQQLAATTAGAEAGTGGVLESWQQEPRLVNYLHRSVETLSLSDIYRLHAEYRLLARACASLVSQQPHSR